MARYKKRRRKSFEKILVMLIGVLLCISISFFLLLKFVIDPNIEEIAKIRAEVLVSRMINKALAQQLAEKNYDDELFTVIEGKDGGVDIVQANSVEINLFMSELSIKLQEAFGQMKPEIYEVPAGSLLGSKIISQMGPGVELSIIPMSVSSMDFKTEFESQGINQTKYKIYIILECRIKVLAPFSSDMINSVNNILIAEAVILGDVPGSYVQVPEEDILDVTTE